MIVVTVLSELNGDMFEEDFCKRFNVNKFLFVFSWLPQASLSKFPALINALITLYVENTLDNFQCIDHEQQ